MNIEPENNGKEKFGFFKKKDPKGITKEEVELEENSPRGIAFFFKLLKRRFSKLLTLNLMMLFQVIPILAAFYVYLQGPTASSITNPVFPTLYGVGLISDSPAIGLLKNLYGIRIHLPVYNSPTYLIIAGILLLLALTWGWQNIGATYNLRSMVRGDPVFMWTDYFYAIKRNLKQGLIVGLFDFAILGTLTFDIFYFSGISGSFWQDVMYFCTVGLAIIYCFMRYYLYIMLITFDLSNFKLFKNALIFSVIGIKRNFFGSLGVLTLIFINFLLAILLLPVGIIVPIILPFVYFLSFSAFITTYSAYPNIQKYMIDPQTSHSDSGKDA